MDRRQFLQGSIALTAAGFHARLLAAPRAAKGGRLLVVFLRGAYDAASALVPISSNFYYDVRPTLAIARPDAANPLAAVRLNDDWGLHPEIARGLAPLLARNQVAFVPFVGVPGASRSHFQVQDQIEAGDDGTQSGRHVDGMLYRLAVATGVEQAISYTPSIPLIFRGDDMIANVRLQRGARSLLQASDRADIDQLYAGDHLGDVLQKADELRRQAGDAGKGGEMKASSRGAGGAGQFKRQAKKMARYLSRSHNLAFVDIGGWDTHVAQGSSSGHLATQFTGLANGLAEFADAMGDAWQDTQVVVISEFGRTFRENGNGGTDHGHGTVYWLLGGKLSGAPVRGPHLALSEATLNEQRDYPVLVDYRALFGEVAGLGFGLPPAQLEKIFGVAPTQFLKT